MTKTLPILLQWNPTSLTGKLKTLWWYKPETLPASTLTLRYNIHRKTSFLLILLIEVAIQSHNSALSCWQACPVPTIKWLKDGHPVGKNVSASNTDTSSQLMIPSAEREDTGIYTILVKNLVGQDSSSIEIRVTGTENITSIHIYSLIFWLLFCL